MSFLSIVVSVFPSLWCHFITSHFNKHNITIINTKFFVCFKVGTIITTFEAEDPDSSAKLIYKIDANACAAKNERGTILKPQDFDCYATFHLEPLSGILSAAKNIDRELVKKFFVGVVVEDVNSDTGLQISAGM